MKYKKKLKNSDSENSTVNGKKISRKEAMKKAGYMVFSAATMLLLLNQPGKAQETSQDPDNPDDW